PTGTILMIALLVMSGLLEGVSVITLVPLLEVATTLGGADAAQEGGIGAAIRDQLLAVGIEPTVWVLIAVVVLAITLKSVVLWEAMRQVGYTVAKVTLDLRLQLVRALAAARWSYFGGRPIGELANSLSREAVRSA